MTALVVDDDRDDRLVLVTTLRSAGWQVIEAEDGKVAISALRTFSPDLIVTDLAMPDFDGIELIIYLRKNRPEIPVIAISGTFNNAVLSAARRLGAQATLQKPVSQTSLWAALQAVGLPPEMH